MRRIGCLTPLGLTAATLALLAALVMGFVSGGTMFSPGGLSAENEYGLTLGNISSHDETRGDCARCHPEPWSNQTMAVRCLTCHTNVQAELRDPKSLHSAFADVSNCRDCHTEHRGAQAEITRFDSNFPHEKVGFALTRHQKLANGNPFKCADCHTKSIATFDRAQCETCHRETGSTFAVHVGDFGNNCLACHDGTDRFSKFDHKTLAFALIGKHSSVKCSGCHVNTRVVADLKKVSQTCVDCHRKDDKHKNAYGTDCAKCHTAEDWKKATFDHNLAAFKLTGKHATVDCAKCHVNNVFKGTPKTCVDCHRKDDKHKNVYGTDCAKCHVPDDWKKATFDHNLAAFKLTGKHTTVECAKCHVNNVFKGTLQKCVDCHRKDDKHKNAYGTDCAKCHTTDDWKKATFDHNLAAFKLTGKHTMVECAKCHVNNVFKGTPQTCVACHPDPDKHRGQFGTDCAQCHKTDTWKGATFKHTFPLNHGRSGTIACATCHTTPNNYKAYTCYGCHEHDPGAIQRKHLEERITKFDDCARCHPTGQEGKDD